MVPPMLDTPYPEAEFVISSFRRFDVSTFQAIFDGILALLFVIHAGFSRLQGQFLHLTPVCAGFAMLEKS